MSPNQFRAPTLARLSRKLSGSHRAAAPWGARNGDDGKPSPLWYAREKQILAERRANEQIGLEFSLAVVVE
jgi:hypothetical protein